MRFPQTFIDDLRRQADIVRVVQDYVALKKKGANWMACCPFHQEKTPSFSVNPAKDIFYCFGCVEENELIWTRDGLKPIAEVRPGEQVLDKHGGWQQVLNVIYKPADELLGFSTAAFRHDPLWLTPDHTCIFAGREHVVASVPYIFQTAERSLKFLSAKKHTRRSGKYRDALRLSEGRADELKAGDYLVFPVIPDSLRVAHDLFAPDVINPRENRVNGVRVEALPLNERTARLYGLWLAEGSVGRGFVRWTFHANSRDTFAAELISILKEEFGLKATIYQYPDKPNTCEVNCSKTDLACQLTYWFGRGAANKKLPAQALYWPVNIQKALLSGYRDGDGDKQGMSTSISRQLSYGIFALAIQARENIALYRYNEHTDKTGLHHKEFWNHYPRQRECFNGFYETVGGTNYYFSPITKIERSTGPRRVVDITVSETSSFATKLGVMHNCGKGGSVFNFVMEIERVSFPEAVRIVAEKANVPLPAMEQDQKFETRRREADDVIELNAWALEWWEQHLAAAGGEAQAGREYLEQRGITEETRRAFRLGFAPNSWEGLSAHLKRKGASAAQIERSGLVVVKDGGGHYDRFRGRVIFPVMDAQGRPVAFGGRVLTPDEQPKYLNSPETAAYTKGRHLYGLHLTRDDIRRKGFAILVEGYLDLIVPYQAGVRNMVASLGTALTPEQARLLGRFARKVVVNYDGDRAGVKAAQRAIETLLAENFELKVLVLPDGADPDEFIRAHGVEAYHERRGKAQPFTQFVIEQATRGRNLHNPPEKGEAVKEVLPFVRAVREPLQRREYFDQALDALRVEDAGLRRALWREVNARAAGDSAAADVKEQVARAARVPPTVAEQRLLELLAHDAELRAEVLGALEPEVYAGLPTEPLFAALRDIDAAGAPVDFDALIERAGDDEELRKLVALVWWSEPVRAEGEALDDVRASAASCLTALRLMYAERRLKELSAAITAAERGGDEAGRDRLVLEHLEWTRWRNALLPRQ
jgi:DNA primase